jgi:small subunit ribosomal protein S4e
MLDKYGGTWAPRSREGPHKLRESLPLALLLRERLKYALNYRECNLILKQRLVTVDGKVRTDRKFPCGFMDVIQIEKTGDCFRLLYDVKGRFITHKIDDNEAKFKLCKVRAIKLGKKGIPHLYTHDGRTIRYPDPDILANDTVKIDLDSGKIISHIRFEVGNLAMISGGRNLGRVGVIENREKHVGSFEVIHIRDAAAKGSPHV